MLACRAYMESHNQVVVIVYRNTCDEYGDAPTELRSCGTHSRYVIRIFTAAADSTNVDLGRNRHLSLIFRTGATPRPFTQHCFLTI